MIFLILCGKHSYGLNPEEETAWMRLAMLIGFIIGLLLPTIVLAQTSATASASASAEIISADAYSPDGGTSRQLIEAPDGGGTTLIFE